MEKLKVVGEKFKEVGERHPWSVIWLLLVAVAFSVVFAFFVRFEQWTVRHVQSKPSDMPVLCLFPGGTPRCDDHENKTLCRDLWKSPLGAFAEAACDGCPLTVQKHTRAQFDCFIVSDSNTFVVVIPASFVYDRRWVLFPSDEFDKRWPNGLEARHGEVTSGQLLNGYFQFFSINELVRTLATERISNLFDVTQSYGYPLRDNSTHVFVKIESNLIQRITCELCSARDRIWYLFNFALWEFVKRVAVIAAPILVAMISAAVTTILFNDALLPAPGAVRRPIDDAPKVFQDVKKKKK